MQLLIGGLAVKSVKVYDTNKRQRMFDIVVGDNGKAVIVAKIGKQLYEVELEAVEKLADKIK